MPKSPMLHRYVGVWDAHGKLIEGKFVGDVVFSAMKPVEGDWFIDYEDCDPDDPAAEYWMTGVWQSRTDIPGCLGDGGIWVIDRASVSENRIVAQSKYREHLSVCVERH